MPRRRELFTNRRFGLEFGPSAPPWTKWPGATVDAHSPCDYSRGCPIRLFENSPGRVHAHVGGIANHLQRLNDAGQSCIDLRVRFLRLCLF